MGISYEFKAKSFWEVLANKAIGVFTELSLPGMIGMGEGGCGV